MKLAQKALLVVAIPFGFEIVCAGIVAALLVQIEAERQDEVHARDVSYHIGQMMQGMLDRGITQFERHLDDAQSNDTRYHQSADDMSREYMIIHELVKDHPQERDAIGVIMKRREDIDTVFTNARKANKLESKTESVKYWTYFRNELLVILNLMQNSIDQAQLTQVESRHNQYIFRIVSEGMLVVLLLFDIAAALVGARFFNRSVVRRMNILIDNTERMAKGSRMNAPLTGNDEITSLDAFFTNMYHAIEQSRAAERAVVDNAVDVICAADLNGVVSEINNAAFQNWGYEPEELVGKRLDSLLFEDDLANFRGALERASKEPETTIAIDARIIRRDRHVSYMRWSISYSSAEKNIYCVVHDITAQKEVDQLRRDFVGMVSHDLKTPLTSLVITHELFSSGAYGELHQEAMARLGVAGRNAAQLLLLVDNVLDVEKMEAGELDIAHEPVDIDEVLSLAVESIFRFSETPDINVRLPAACGVKVYGDKSKLVQVVANLLSYSINLSAASVEMITQRERDLLKVSLVFVPTSSNLITEAEFEHGIQLRLARSIVKRIGGEVGVFTDQNDTFAFWFSLTVVANEAKVGNS